MEINTLLDTNLQVGNYVANAIAVKLKHKNVVIKANERYELIKNPDYRKMRFLKECDLCKASRKLNPHIREEIESIIVDKFKLKKRTHIHVVSFADSGFYQTLVLIQKLLLQNPVITSFELDLIDPMFVKLLVDEETLVDFQKNCRLYTLNKLQEFLEWFSPMCTTINVYADIKMWKECKIDLCFAIDMGTYWSPTVLPDFFIIKREIIKTRYFYCIYTKQ